MFDRGTGNVGVSRGDRAAGKLPCLKLANPQAKSTLRFNPKPGATIDQSLTLATALFDKYSQ